MVAAGVPLRHLRGLRVKLEKDEGPTAAQIIPPLPREAAGLHTLGTTGDRAILWRMVREREIRPFFFFCPNRKDCQSVFASLGITPPR